MATIDNLPPEILQEIFLYICIVYQEFRYHLNLHHDRVNTRTTPPQHHLLQVSRRWNTIASSSTRLWSSMAVTVNAPAGPPDFRTVVRFLHFALQRAGRTALLDIDLHMAREPQFWRALSPVLLPQSHRWRRFVLGLDADMDAPLDPEEFATLRGRLPNLEWLELERGDDTESTPAIVKAISKMVEDVPRLLKLGCGFQHLEIKFRWDQIQELVLHSVDFETLPSFWDHFRQALVASTSLLKLTLTGDFERIPPNATCLPARSLSIQEFTQTQLKNWFMLLELPALRKACIRFGGRDHISTHFIRPNEHLPTFTNFIRQSNCTLTTLEIGIDFIFGCWTAEEHARIIDLYALLPCLTSLSLLILFTDWMPNPSDDPTNPVLPIVSPNTLPSLAVLRVHWSPDRPTTALAVADVILPMLTGIIQGHRPALELVGFAIGYEWYEGCFESDTTRVDWAALEALNAFVDLGSCDEIYRMNCWHQRRPNARKYEYSLVRANST
ncbi:hypothetical protein CYLTODRAFT_422322 [Cylindrobasidium torrendii FP15055 ss-10]|uniref:Uncharacterized protein n=1 Tax=Cylindrobasidium torrendii FP15055 ss-10 TaxID=1314674 RepID=A0A0D7BDP0_9AGAR|nr:hypothetical protein CYLTODRAFT_422322 [Cylindrobasidium torrendii FP15055 ss-10]